MSPSLRSVIGRVVPTKLHSWLHRVHVARVDKVERHVAAATGRIVAAGPFAGTRLAANPMWNRSAVYLSGAYESELHGAIEELIDRDPTTVIDVGCADGYYAVGLALRLRAARILAFDVDENAQAACTLNADANGVRERVEVKGLCTAAMLGELANESTLLVVDCEGGELDLLHPDQVPALATAAILVELHDFVDPQISSTILDRFNSTHVARLVTAQPRDPSGWPALDGLTALERATALDERRPTDPHPMQWAVLLPR